MLRVSALAATLLVALGAAGGLAATATAGSSDPGETYRKYALVREQLVTCSLDRTWRHLGGDQRKRCTRIRKLYTLWSEPGESYRYHVHCKTKKCPAQPVGEPDPRAPIPRGAVTFR